MRILMTNHSLQYTGGTEKWTYALARELDGMGHDIDVFTFMRGVTSEHLEPFARVLTELDTTARYDLILANHNTCQALVAALPGFKVFTCHGPSHHLERPGPGADAYVAVSAEVRAAYASLVGDMAVITNGVDLGEFRPAPRPARTPRVLSMCKMRTARNMVADVCRDMGFDFEGVAYAQAPVWDIARLMRAADIVVGCGRSAIEGLACGCDVLVFDARMGNSPRADGWIMPSNVEHLRQVNFSCRAFGVQWGEKELAEELQWHGTVGVPMGWARAWAEENADITDVATSYLALMDRAGAPAHDPDLTAEYEGVV